MVTNNTGNHSEVARLRAQIEREHQAASWALNAPALGTAQHWFISRRMERIGDCQAQLASVIGEQESMKIIVDIMAASPEQRKVP